MHSLVSVIWLLSIVHQHTSAEPIPFPSRTLLTARTPTLTLPRAATTTADAEDKWWDSQSTGIHWAIIIGAILALALFGWILGKVCLGWTRVKTKYFKVPYVPPPPTQGELNQCWSMYGEKDMMGQPRPANLQELKTCWASHGSKIRAYNRPSGAGYNAGGGDSGGGGGGGDGGGGGGGGGDGGDGGDGGG